MNFNAAIIYCEQNPDKKLYAMSLDLVGMLSIYSLENVRLEDGKAQMMFMEAVGEVFDCMAFENEHDLEQAAEMCEELVFFHADEMESTEDDFLGFLTEKFPSLLNHSKTQEDFVLHAVYCIQAFNLDSWKEWRGWDRVQFKLQ